MRAIDHNVLVRLVTRDDPAQTKRAESFIASGAWVSHLVLVECIWVLETVYGFGRRKVWQLVEMLLEHESLAVQDVDVVRNALADIASTQADFSDCLIVSVARKAGHSPTGTFDVALAEVPGATGL